MRSYIDVPYNDKQHVAAMEQALKDMAAAGAYSSYFCANK